MPDIALLLQHPDCGGYGVEMQLGFGTMFHHLPHKQRSVLPKHLEQPALAVGNQLGFSSCLHCFCLWLSLWLVAILAIIAIVAIVAIIANLAKKQAAPTIELVDTANI